jgi:hypothetical protein
LPFFWPFCRLFSLSLWVLGSSLEGLAEEFREFFLRLPMRDVTWSMAFSVDGVKAPFAAISDFRRPITMPMPMSLASSSFPVFSRSIL